MKLHKAQNRITIIFILLMVVNMVGGMTLHNVTDTFPIYLSIYGVHLSIILTYYFVQDPIADREVPAFRFLLLLMLVLIWNGIILGITVSSAQSVAALEENLGMFPDYADFLIAGGIVWMFNGKAS